MPGLNGTLPKRDDFTRRLNDALDERRAPRASADPTTSPVAQVAPEEVSRRLEQAAKDAQSDAERATAAGDPQNVDPFRDRLKSLMGGPAPATRQNANAGPASMDEEEEESDYAEPSELDDDVPDDTDEETSEPAPAPNAATGPIGAGEHVVREGDCISSIAAEAGHLWTTIWDHPANEPLRAARQDPNVLLVDDRVTVPELTRKDEPGATEMRHRFRRRGEPCRFKVSIWGHDAPRAGEPYRLEVGGKVLTGALDGAGLLDVFLPAKAKRGTLTVGADEQEEQFDVLLGALPPISEISGVQARLQNLGFYFGEISGDLDDETRLAIANFQEELELEMTGEPDAPTRAALDEEHD